MRIPRIYHHRPADDMLACIYMAMRSEDITFSKTQAAKIVGGRYVLERLVKQKKIRVVKPGMRQNARWECNGEDVLRHVQDYFLTSVTTV